MRTMMLVLVGVVASACVAAQDGLMTDEQQPPPGAFDQPYDPTDELVQPDAGAELVQPDAGALETDALAQPAPDASTPAPDAGQPDAAQPAADAGAPAPDAAQPAPAVWFDGLTVISQTNPDVITDLGQYSYHCQLAGWRYRQRWTFLVDASGYVTIQREESTESSWSPLDALQATEKLGDLTAEQTFEDTHGGAFRIRFGSEAKLVQIDYVKHGKARWAGINPAYDDGSMCQNVSFPVTLEWL